MTSIFRRCLVGVRVTVGGKTYTEEEAIKKGLISKSEAELVEKAGNLLGKFAKQNRKSKKGKK